MLAFLRNLIGLNSILATKIQSDRLYTEAEAFCSAGQHAEGFLLMCQASEFGNPHATVQAAMMLLKGQGTACDWKRAAELLQLAVARGIVNVHFNLGMIYGIGGYGLKRDGMKAEFHLSNAQNADNDPAAHQVLTMLRNKQGVFAGKEVPRPIIPWK